MFRRLRAILGQLGGGERSEQRVGEAGPVLSRIGEAIGVQIRAVLRAAAAVEAGEVGGPMSDPATRHTNRENEMSDKQKQEVSFEGTLPLERIVSYLRELADGFERGSVPVERGLEKLTLIPASSVELEVKAKIKKRKHALRLELEWDEPEHADELKIG